METPDGSPREQGVQALRAGRVDEAIELLAQAVAADGRDAEAHAFLGVAHSQKGCHTRARQSLQSAVALAPGNPHYRFNLGVALERAGDVSGAAEAYRETLVIHPQHPQARRLLQGLGTAAGRAGAGAPGPRRSGARDAAAPWLRGQLPATVPQSGLAGDRRLPGSVRCARCGEWQKPGLSCEFCSASLPETAT